MARTLAVAVIAIIVVGVVGTFYYYGGNLPSFTSSPGGSSGTQSVTASSAQLEDGGNLVVNLTNQGQKTTSSVELLSACTPDFAICSSIGSQNSTFVLPPGNSFKENFAISQCGSAPDIAPCWGGPINGQSYYYKLRVFFQGGGYVDVPVTATAKGKFLSTNAFSAPIQNDTMTITAVNLANVAVFDNLTGRMSVVITVSTPYPPSISAYLVNRSEISGEFGYIPIGSPLVTATAIGCSQGCLQVIPAYNAQVSLTANFSTVTTGIVRGEYYLLTINIANFGSYFLWVETTPNVVSYSSTTTSSSFSCPTLLAGLNVSETAYNAQTGNLTVLVRNANSYAVVLGIAEAEPYTGTALFPNQVIPAQGTSTITLSSPSFEDLAGPGTANEFSFSFAPAGSNVTQLASQGMLCSVFIKVIASN